MEVLDLKRHVRMLSNTLTHRNERSCDAQRMSSAAHDEERPNSRLTKKKTERLSFELLAGALST
jgi:hypothetical protein